MCLVLYGMLHMDTLVRCNCVVVCGCFASAILTRIVFLYGIFMELKNFRNRNVHWSIWRELLTMNQNRVTSLSEYVPDHNCPFVVCIVTTLDQQKRRTCLFIFSIQFSLYNNDVDDDNKIFGYSWSLTRSTN